MRVDRRDFLKGAGLGLVAGALAPGATLAREAPNEARSATAGAEAAPNDWEAVRAQFSLSPDWIHLAGLLLSSHPTPVQQRIERHRRGLDENPPHYLYGDASSEDAAARRAAAAYLGADASEVALTGNTTMGLALLYNGLELRPGQELLTTTHDHRVTHESLRFKAARTGAELRQITLYRNPRTATAGEIADSLRRAVRPRTRVVAVTWVHSSTGVKLPIRALADALAEVNAGRDAEDRALLCVDGVHGLGVEAAGVDELGCDFFAAGTHKWLFGPRGTGILWGHPRAHRAVTPTVPTFTRDGSWGGTMSPGGFHPFEHRWAVAQAFELHQRLGKVRVAERIHGLNSHMKEGLAGMRHVTLYTPADPALSSGIVCFDVHGRTPGRLVGRLRERGIIASRTPYATSYARFTPGLLNTPEEIEVALRAVREMA